MSWLTGQHSAFTYICPEDRYVTKSSESYSFNPDGKVRPERSFRCPKCSKPLINMWHKWRAPKKRNDKAWNKILDGNIWWDEKVIVNSNDSQYSNDHLTKYFLKQLAERS